jgi:hypothetical protein
MTSARVATSKARWCSSRFAFFPSPRRPTQTVMVRTEAERPSAGHHFGVDIGHFKAQNLVYRWIFQVAYLQDYMT